MNYNYNRFQGKYYNFDKFDGPEVGEMAIDFEAYDLDGNRVKLSDYKGRTIVLETGSVTCPIYSNNVERMQQLREEFPDVEFILLYVREAHPGNKIGNHETLEDKISMAKMLGDVDGENRTILVDTLSGDAHNIYTAFPNFVYVIDSDFIVRYRVEWNDPEAVRQVLLDPKANPVPSPGKGGIIRNIRVLRRGGINAIFHFLPVLPRLMRSRKKLRKRWITSRK